MSDYRTRNILSGLGFSILDTHIRNDKECISYLRIAPYTPVFRGKRPVSPHSEDAYLYTTMIERVNTVITGLACRGCTRACSFRQRTRPGVLTLNPEP